MKLNVYMNLQDQVEHDWKASSDASKVRRHLWTSSGGGQTSQPPTPTSAPASSNVQQLKLVKIEGEKDNVGKSAGPKKRKGPKHSDDTVLPPPHKVKTRHATKSEIGTGIDSPSESRTITLKSYKAINTPPTDANTRRKMSLDKVRLIMAHESQITFLGIFNISKCWGPSGGQLTYAGCGRALRDERPCGLGIVARASRDQGSSSPSSQSSTPELKSRDRSGHTCAESGADKHMFHFFVQTAEEDYILEVWDRAGQSLFNITGQEFFETFGSDITQLHQFVYSRLSSSSWAIKVIGKPTARGNLKAVSFSHVKLTSPAVHVESAQGQVGVVKVRDSSRGKESAEPSSTSGPRPRASLLAMLRLQARLDDMRKDIAEAITALKLEQEEEFVDSNCDWVESL
ncbi:hypothetical protein R1sor_013272 [Riccia sorocarpa]|uniref:Uncharacterized protein n=1 Tax=Riccia sorocarpa TaxID=122646 RepID=A0ABD3H6M2_9MARC